MIRVAFTIGDFMAVLGLLIIARATGAQKAVALSPASLTLEQEIKGVEAEIDKTFADTLAQLPSILAGTAHRMKRVQTLGKLELFDKQLSVNRNTACTFCHMLAAS
jgi:cytochrome c peroxidase